MKLLQKNQLFISMLAIAVQSTVLIPCYAQSSDGSDYSNSQNPSYPASQGIGGNSTQLPGIGNLLKKIPAVNRYASQAANYVNRYTNNAAPVQQFAPAGVNKLMQQSQMSVQEVLQSGANSGAYPG
ncbi:MAG: hypothetical protein K2X81_11230, partial [Candidatus Obscuribacterales bacterium]|nr:hypothetical protein [Candidatus Obscuribacterales bacterium]